MTVSFEEVLKKHTVKIRGMASRLSRGFGGVQNVDDLASAGIVALWQCYQRFDSKRLPETDFWIYAQRRVQGSMFDSMRSRDHIGRRARKLVKEDEMEGLSWGAVHQVSMEKLRDLPSASDPHADLATKLEHVLVGKLLSKLPPRHQLVICMYFLENLTLRVVGKRLKITESRASQIKMKALAALKELADEFGIRD
jgi:RNA polymerase sigma factor for flagellar operon FliA